MWRMFLAFCLAFTCACSDVDDPSKTIESTTSEVVGETVATVEPVPSEPRPCSAGPSGQGCVYGVFVGMAENDVEPDLPYADQDVRRLTDALTRAQIMRREDAVLLISRRATLRSFKRSVRELAARMRPQDIFLFFFSGHGNREGVALWKSQLTKSDLSRLLHELPVQQALLVMDTCHAGAFASLTRRSNAPRMVGWFSSEADETSVVPREGETSGYLADLFIRSVTEVRGPGRWIYASDLSTYVQRRYRTAEEQGDQHLVVDGSNMALWRAPAASLPH